MALQDIFDAIIAESNAHIAACESHHDQSIANADASAREELRRLESDLHNQSVQKIEQASRAARQQADQARRTAVLRRKREHMDALYQSVLKALSEQSDAAVEPLFTVILSRLHGGEIRPAQKHAALLTKLAKDKKFVMGKPIDALGGFLCVTDTREEDWRFESIVETLLRPRTEQLVASTLFPAQVA